MRDDTVPRKPCTLWIDWKEHVVSFHPDAGFEAKEFPDYDAMMQFVFQYTSNGFRIQ